MPDPGSDFFLSRIQTVSFPDPGSESKNFSILAPKKWFLSSRKYDPGSRIPDPDADFLPIPDLGVKKAPDPGCGSATLILVSVSDQDPDPDPDWIRSQMGQRIRIQAGQNCPPKKKKVRKNSCVKISVGLKTSPGAWMFFVGVKKTYMTVFDRNFFLHYKKPWSGSGFSNSLILIRVQQNV